MAKQTLPVNFKDDILNSSMGGKRRYNLIQNSDGTVSLEDVTSYTQVGSDFGAAQMNQTNKAVNESCDKADVIDDLEDIVANQADGMIAGAKALATLNADLSEFLNRCSYSDSGEIETNETWVDGKKIYRRTFITTETVSPNNTITIPMSLTNIADTLWIDTQNSYIRSADGGQSYPLPLPRYSGTANYVGVWCNGAGIRIFSDSGWNQQWEKCVTVRYTKKSRSGMR